jgi:hypothetical protein
MKLQLIDGGVHLPAKLRSHGECQRSRVRLCVCLALPLDQALFQRSANTQLAIGANFSAFTRRSENRGWVQIGVVATINCLVMLRRLFVARGSAPPHVHDRLDLVPSAIYVVKVLSKHRSLGDLRTRIPSETHD